MNWPEHPFISQRTARRIFGRANIAAQGQSSGNELYPVQYFTVTPPAGATAVGKIMLLVRSQMEEDDDDEDAQHDYRKVKVTAEYDPARPYSRYHATRLAQRLRRAAAQARNELVDNMSWSERATTYPTFFEASEVEAAAQERFIPQRYRLWGPFTDHPRRHKLPEPT